MKRIATTTLKLLAAGELLTGVLVMMHKLTETSSPQISGQDVTYNSDMGMALIKFESLQGGGQTKMSTPKIVGWILFRTFIILLAIPVIKAIIKIIKICNRRTDKYSHQDNAAEEPVSHNKYVVNFKPHVPHMLEDMSKPNILEQSLHPGSSNNIQSEQQESAVVIKHPEDEN